MKALRLQTATDLDLESTHRRVDQRGDNDSKLEAEIANLGGDGAGVPVLAHGGGNEGPGYEHADEGAEAFNPDRFTPKDEGGDGEPFLVGPFGFGRRICVGRHLAQASVWIMVATMVATMDISAPLNPDGTPFDQPIKFSTGLSSHPGKFDVVFAPRSDKAMALLKAANGDAQ